MLTRRTFLTSAAIAAARPLAAAAPRVTVEPLEVISKQPEFYHGWPTIARRSDGQLLTVWSGGREAHVCPFGRVEMMRSSDDGRTWSWPEVLMDSVIDDRDAGICETTKGTLLVTTFTSLAYEATLAAAKNWTPEKTARWAAVNRRATAEQRRALLGTWMLRSTDGGMAWSAPYRVPLNSPHGPIALASGRLLYAGKRLWDADNRVGVAVSDDDGVTWRWLADLPVRPGDNVVGYHELHAVETADGRILVHIRNENPANNRETLQCESKDGGRTWTMPAPIVWGLPAHLLRLRDGRLLMSYGYRRAPFGNRVSISEDHGRTWSEGAVISADGASGDLGYPSTVQLSGNRFLTVWYEQLASSRQAVLRQARWTLG